MNGICLYDYVKDGVMVCAVAAPWWLVGLTAIALCSIIAIRSLK